MISQHNQNEPNERSEGLRRREVIKGAAAAGLIATTGTHALVHAAESKAARSDLIKRENAKSGTRDWLLTKTRTVPKKITPHLTSGRSMGPDGAQLMGARWTPPGRGSGDWTCAMPEHCLSNL